MGVSQCNVRHFNLGYIHSRGKKRNKVHHHPRTSKMKIFDDRADNKRLYFNFQRFAAENISNVRNGVQFRRKIINIHLRELLTCEKTSKSWVIWIKFYSQLTGYKIHLIYALERVIKLFKISFWNVLIVVEKSFDMKEKKICIEVLIRRVINLNLRRNFFMLTFRWCFRDSLLESKELVDTTFLRN